MHRYGAIAYANTQHTTPCASTHLFSCFSFWLPALQANSNCTLYLRGHLEAQTGRHGLHQPRPSSRNMLAKLCLPGYHLQPTASTAAVEPSSKSMTSGIFGQQAPTLNVSIPSSCGHGQPAMLCQIHAARASQRTANGASPGCHEAAGAHTAPYPRMPKKAPIGAASQYH